ncbi:uncharacterized protein LOC126058124 isoform X1 [Elephas maximus indicus]|uniref:uncharacterized protein LOC126058124 isoform X1 n=1 Tax=Elephas maximus indicus TaxID=99487 RepID=UPI002115E7D7|nr:uncharacterized protein LOC126058124 isoform X1 [Elephas maximus indicus]
MHPNHKPKFTLGDQKTWLGLSSWCLSLFSSSLCFSSCSSRRLQTALFSLTSLFLAAIRQRLASWWQRLGLRCTERGSRLSSSSSKKTRQLKPWLTPYSACATRASRDSNTRQQATQRKPRSRVTSHSGVVARRLSPCSSPWSVGSGVQVWGPSCQGSRLLTRDSVLARLGAEPMVLSSESSASKTCGILPTGAKEVLVCQATATPLTVRTLVKYAHLTHGFPGAAP